MNDLSVGAVGAAMIAALVSLFGLIIGKEQKTSEFRQAWIDALRAEIVKYSANVKTISNSLKANFKTVDDKVTALTEPYKALNEASYAIKMRLNFAEEASASILQIMDRFEAAFKDDLTTRADSIRPIEDDFVRETNLFLKSEWNRVKRGEPIFRLAKWGTFIIAALLALVLGAQVLRTRGIQSLNAPELAVGPEDRDWRTCSRNWAIRLASANEAPENVASTVLYVCRKSILPARSQEAKERALLFIRWVRSTSSE